METTRRLRCLVAAVAGTLAVQAQGAAAANLVVDTVAPESPHDIALALDAGGVPHVSYNIGTSLKYAVKSSATWTVETVDSAGTYQSFSDIAVDAAGAPHVCWSPNGTWYAEKTTGSWHSEPIDPGAGSSQVSMALDVNGTPHVVYRTAGGVLNYAVRTGAGWVMDPVDAAAWGPSLVLDDAGDPHVAYAMSTGPLKYAVRKNGAWSHATVDSVATSGGAGYFDPPSLELDSAGEPHVSYMANFPDYNLKYAERVAGTWVTAVVDSAGLLGWYNSLELDAADRPHITYTGASDELIYVRHDGAVWIFDTLDLTPGVGDFNSLRLTLQGPHVAYRDYPGSRLLYAHPDPATAATPPPAARGGLVLEAPRPNPRVGAGGATFRFTLPAAETLRLAVHDVRGRRVAAWESRVYAAGTHEVAWDPGDAASGVYWIRLTTASGRAAQARWVLLR